MAQDTKTRILTSAVELFAENNYHGVSMTEIAEGAEISKGTLYWHFDSKKELFREIAFSGMDHFHRLFTEIVNKEGTSKEKIKNLIECVLETLVDNLNILDVFRNNIELINNNFKNTLELKHRQNIGVVTNIIEQGIAEGFIKDADPNDIATIILTVLFTPQTKKLLDGAENVDQKIDFIYDFLMNGISREED